jgi:hypothetical protein
MQKPNFVETGNPCAKYYQVSQGHPIYAPRARFLGKLKGSWYEIGYQVGTKAGDLVRLVSDVWWKEHVDNFGVADTIKAMSLYESQIEAFNPELIKFMEGIADGAEEELEKSPYAHASSHYQKILNTNIFDEWSWRQPKPLPWKKASENIGCSSFVTIGDDVNRLDEMIATHNRHCPFNPKCYQLVYIGQPRDGNAFWVLTPGGAGSGCQIVNDKGVSIILNAGGDQHEKYNADAFGIPWFILFPHVASYANSAEDAIEMITKGTSEYRTNTKRNSLLRGGTWNFLVSDKTSCAVVETTCDRYAIRRPGDVSEIGNYIVMTNHNYCDYSFDENNERTTIPMTQFGNEETSPGSAKRFWTMMWDIRHNYGRIDLEMAKELMCGHHQYDRDGNRIESPEGGIPLQFTGDVTCPHSGYPETWERGTADAKIAVNGDDLKVYWTLGRPCEWQGRWDEASLA